MLFEVLKNNRIYVILAIFLILVNILFFLGERAMVKEEAEITQSTGQSGVRLSSFMFDDEEISVREEKLRQLTQDNPSLYIFLGLVNLTVLFMIFIGLLLDIFFTVRAIKKQPVIVRSNYPEPPRWTVGDVVRVILIFMSFGYAFVIAQAFVAEFFPVLYNDNFRMVFNTAAANIVAITVIMHFVVKKYGHKISDLGLTRKEFPKNVFTAMAGYLSLLPVLLVIMMITFFLVRLFKYEPPVQPIVKLFMEEDATGILWMSALFAAIFGPVAEEIFFRGFMYPAIRKKLGVAAGLMLTSAVFAGLHAHIVGFMPIMALGMLLGYLYEKTGSLVSSMSVHIFHNLAMVSLVFLVRGLGL